MDCNQICGGASTSASWRAASSESFQVLNNCTKTWTRGWEITSAHCRLVASPKVKEDELQQLHSHSSLFLFIPLLSYLTDQQQAPPQWISGSQIKVFLKPESKSSFTTSTLVMSHWVTVGGLTAYLLVTPPCGTVAVLCIDKAWIMSLPLFFSFSHHFFWTETPFLELQHICRACRSRNTHWAGQTSPSVPTDEGGSSQGLLVDGEGRSGAHQSCGEGMDKRNREKKSRWRLWWEKREVG